MAETSQAAYVQAQWSCATRWPLSLAWSCRRLSSLTTPPSLPWLDTLLPTCPHPQQGTNQFLTQQWWLLSPLRLSTLMTSGRLPRSYVQAHLTAPSAAHGIALQASHMMPCMLLCSSALLPIPLPLTGIAGLSAS